MSARVLITGSASGLGAALAARYAARGDRVLVTDRADTAPDSLPAGAAYRRLDVTSQEDWDAAREWVESEWGGLDLLVNNAGVAAGGRIELYDLEDWQWITEINLFGTVRGCRTFTPLMQRQGSGRLVNIASMAGLVHPPAMSSYNAVKAGVVALSESLHWELEPYGIGVSVVCPTFFRTNLASSLRGGDAVMNESAKRLINRSRLGAEEIAARVVEGVDAGRHLVLTDKAGRKAYWAKRLLRPFYDRQMRTMAARLHGAVLKSRAQEDGAGRPGAEDVSGPVAETAKKPQEESS